MDRVSPLPPYTPPTAEAPTRGFKFVVLRHPGLINKPPFLKLAAFEVDGCFGIPHHVALAAASLVAHNATGGRLTTEDGDPISEEDNWLHAGYYCFETANGPQYTICETFRLWNFPSGLPVNWDFRGTELFDKQPDHVAPSSVTEVVRKLDTHCLLSGALSGLCGAHLVPRSEKEWWEANRMDLHLDTGYNTVDQTANVITLRSDLDETLMDAGHFAFTPYGPQKQVVAVFLTSASSDLVNDFHLKAVHLPERIHPYCVFAQFAYAIFKANRMLLQTVQLVPSIAATIAPNAARANTIIPTRYPVNNGLAINAAASEDDVMDTADVGGGHREISGDVADAEENKADDEEDDEDPLDLSCRYSEEDYIVRENHEAAAAKLGYGLASFYPGSTEILRLKNERLWATRSPGNARIATIFEPDDEQAL
ncbi:hypothetical protein MKEN_00367500 [Mycena kentingensis (nom. inval.)]|nr:hypothetical protein MKEN_00367500 [Mycena kentingensis (nom. inval.)]